MKIYEKAIENYARNRKKFYDLKLKQDILWFNESVERMTATGECPVAIQCDDCPMRLVGKEYKTGCGVESNKYRRDIIAMEYKEEKEI